MDCKICEVCVIGHEYPLSRGYCLECSYTHTSIMIGTYKGLSEAQHRFDVDFICPGCGIPINEYWIPCKDDSGGINVTEEFNIMFHKKESHWVGQSAKR